MDFLDYETLVRWGFGLGRGLALPACLWAAYEDIRVRSVPVCCAVVVLWGLYPNSWHVDVLGCFVAGMLVWAWFLGYLAVVDALAFVLLWGHEDGLGRVVIMLSGFILCVGKVFWGKRAPAFGVLSLVWVLCHALGF